MTYLNDLEAISPLPIWTGVVARPVRGEQLSFAHIELDPNSHVPEHQHENEQLGILVHGAMTFRIGDETKECVPGSTWSIPANVPHEAHAGPDGAVAIEAFVPRRADWDQFEPQPASAPRWPA